MVFTLGIGKQFNHLCSAVLFITYLWHKKKGGKNQKEASEHVSV